MTQGDLSESDNLRGFVNAILDGMDFDLAISVYGASLNTVAGRVTHAKKFAKEITSAASYSRFQPIQDAVVRNPRSEEESILRVIEFASFGAIRFLLAKTDSDVLRHAAFLRTNKDGKGCLFVKNAKNYHDIKRRQGS